jgi:hypothetical protein
MTERLRIPPQYDRGWSSLGKMTMDHALAAPAPRL